MTGSHLNFQRDHNPWPSVESHSRIFVGYLRPHLRTSFSGIHTRGSFENRHRGFLMLHIGCSAKADHPTLMMINHNAEGLWIPQQGERANIVGLFREKNRQTLSKLLFCGAFQNQPSPDCCSFVYKYNYWLRWECKMDGWERPALLESSATLSCAQILSEGVKHATYVYEIMDHETK